MAVQREASWHTIANGWLVNGWLVRDLLWQSIDDGARKRWREKVANEWLCQDWIQLQRLRSVVAVH